MIVELCVHGEWHPHLVRYDQGETVTEILCEGGHEVEGACEECIAEVTEDYGYSHPCGQSRDEEAHHPDYGHPYEPGLVIPRPVDAALGTKGVKTQTELAGIFGVTQRTISAAVNRKTWKNV